MIWILLAQRQVASEVNCQSNSMMQTNWMTEVNSRVDTQAQTISTHKSSSWYNKWKLC